MISEVRLKGMKLNYVDYEYLFILLNKKIINNKKNHISITNTEAMFIGLNNKKHFEFINNSFLSLCDGIGLVIAGKFNGLKINKYHGPNFFEDVIKEGQKFGWTHYFLGGKEGVAKSLQVKLENKYKDVKILGNYSPPFRELTTNEQKCMINSINNLKPNFVWVSLGLPKQEKWIQKHQKFINSNFFVGVGAAFDFHTGNIKRAPVFYQKIGLEWLYRTIFDTRMIIRQLRGFNFMFRAIFNNKN